MEESYLRNCYIKTRPGDNILVGVIDGNCTIVQVIQLDGYAIVPREEYEELSATFEKAHEVMQE